MFTRDQVASKIREWLEAEKWKLSEFRDANFQLAYKIVLSSGREIYVGLEKSVERVTIQNTLLIPPDVKNIYRLSPNKYKFLDELKVYLMQMGVSTEIYPSFEELESINIANFIYFDGFSRNKLIHEIYKLADATDLVMIMWKKFTESHLPSDQQKY
ncbi:MAG: DUF2299 family protein [Candidatus Nitrosocosmicus sp.]